MSRVVYAAVALAAVLAVAAVPAGAEEARLAPVRDRYEPGDPVTLVGYLGPVPGWQESAPYPAFFRGARVGSLHVEEIAAAAPWALRVSIEFAVPLNSPPGSFVLTTFGPGELTGSYPVSVSVDPPEPIVRQWPLNEPEIANLGAESVVAGPGYRLTAGEIRAAAAPPPAPAVVEAPPIQSAPQASAPPAAAPAPESAVSRPAVNGGWLLFGTAIAVACTGAVLVALRRDSARPVAARA